MASLIGDNHCSKALNVHIFPFLLHFQYRLELSLKGAVQSSTGTSMGNAVVLPWIPPLAHYLIVNNAEAMSELGVWLRVGREGKLNLQIPFKYFIF